MDLAISLSFVGATHLVLDRRGLTRAWMRLIGVNSELDWLSIGIDQVLQLLVTVIIVQFLAWAIR